MRTPCLYKRFTNRFFTELQIQSLMRFSVFLEEKYAEIEGSSLPWCLRDFESLFFFLLYDIQTPEDFKQFIELERPDPLVSFDVAANFCRICNLLVFHLSQIQFLTREEEDKYLKEVESHYFASVWIPHH